MLSVHNLIHAHKVASTLLESALLPYTTKASLVHQLLLHDCLSTPRSRRHSQGNLLRSLAYACAKKNDTRLFHLLQLLPGSAVSIRRHHCRILPYGLPNAHNRSQLGQVQPQGWTCPPPDHCLTHSVEGRGLYVVCRLAYTVFYGIHTGQR